MQKALLCFLFLVISIGSYSQGKSTAIDSLVAITERYYGADDKLFYGRLYRINERGAEGHPFLFHQSFQPAKLFIKGNIFDSIPSRIDLENKLFISRLDQNQHQREVLISDEALDSFLFSGRLFINGKLLHPSLTFYYQGIYRADLILIRSFEKEFIAIYNTGHPKGKYGKLTQKLLLINNENIKDVSAKRRFKKALPEHAQIINAWLKNEHTRFKKLSDEQLIRLLKACKEE